MIVNVSRRDALRAMGGLFLAFSLPGVAEAIEPPDPTIDLGPTPTGADAHLNAWIRIAPDGIVTLRMPQAEMGQGVYTSLPMILAEELDCDWSKVRVESAPAHADYERPLGFFGLHGQLTGGSFSVRMYWDILRKAGASARAMLVAEAAARWQTTPDTCSTTRGIVSSGEHRAAYGELAAGAATRVPPENVRLKDPDARVLMGTAPPRLDIPSKVDGSAVFGVDVRVEGMLQGTVVPCPHYGGKLKKVDDTAARAIKGVVDVLAFPDEIVVVAEHFYQAKKAADALVIEWDPGHGAGVDDAHIESLMTAALEHGKKVQKEGPDDVEGTPLEAVYTAPYLEHATMEPMSATAQVTEDRVDIWTGTQAQSMLRTSVAKLAKVKPDQVYIHEVFLGGGFGRRAELDAPEIAVRAALAVKRPVKLIFTREATFARGALRPGAKCKFKAILGKDRIERMEITIAAQSLTERYLPRFIAETKAGMMITAEGLADGPYAFPSIEVRYGRVALPITIGSWRSVAGSFNGFFRECFLDECALALKKDPIQLRRELLADSPRHLQVLELVADKAGPVPEGHSRGVAIFECFGSIVGEILDARVEGGVVHVARITAAIDCGQHVHPDIIRAQVMSAATMGLSTAFGERRTFTDGRANETNFDRYPILAPAQAPDVDVHIVASKEAPGGVGEPGLPPASAALCNAIQRATGKRIRSLPFGDQLA